MVKILTRNGVENRVQNRVKIWVEKSVKIWVKKVVKTGSKFDKFRGQNLASEIIDKF